MINYLEHKQEHKTIYQSVSNFVLIDQERRPKVKLLGSSNKRLNILSEDR